MIWENIMKRIKKNLSPGRKLDLGGFFGQKYAQFIK